MRLQILTQKPSSSTDPYELPEPGTGSDGLQQALCNGAFLGLWPLAPYDMVCEPDEKLNAADYNLYPNKKQMNLAKGSERVLEIFTEQYEKVSAVNDWVWSKPMQITYPYVHCLHNKMMDYHTGKLNGFACDVEVCNNPEATKIEKYEAYHHLKKSVKYIATIEQLEPNWKNALRTGINRIPFGYAINAVLRFIPDLVKKDHVRDMPTASKRLAGAIGQMRDGLEFGGYMPDKKKKNFLQESFDKNMNELKNSKTMSKISKLIRTYHS